MSSQPRVAVVGAGIAGLCAAIAADDSGARVDIIDRAPEGERGGNSQWTEAYLRLIDDATVSEDFEESLITNGSTHLDANVLENYSRDYDAWPSYVKAHPAADPEVVTSFSEGVAPTLAWLKTIGVRFEALPIYHLAMSAPRIAAVGGGTAIVEALVQRLSEAGLTIRYNVTAKGISRGKQGGIRSIQTEDSRGNSEEVPCDAVILASGGFEGNSEMLARYTGAGSRYLRPVAPGGYFNKGECIEQALAVGAAPAGDYTLYHAEPLDPRSKQPEAVVFLYNHGILVNKQGFRFTDEAPGYSDIHYEGICHRISEQPGGIAYAIFDSSIDDVPNWKKVVRSDKQPITAESIEDMAKSLGITPSSLVRTVDQFNNSCQAGHFDPLDLDGLSTDGIAPAKSNWSRPLNSAPFFAYPIVPGIVFTFGGLKTNGEGQVIDKGGNAIPGLFAAGETVGLYYKNYTGATSVLRSAVFGRKAGTAAARLNAA